ncbi:MAG: GNAT family N-acetyltransferase [Ferruginibacter sp.]
MNIQPLTQTDIPSITELQPEGWGDILPAIEFYTNNNFCFPIKVVMDHVVIGMGTAIIHNDVAWLAHIIVHPNNRNKGIGRLITQTLVDSPQVRNCETIYLIATDLGAPVYEKIGFETDTNYLFFKDIVTGENWINDKNILPYKDEFKNQVAALDKQVSGEDRMFHLDQWLADSYVYLHKNTVEGFYLPAFGEGLIYATNKIAGTELMKYRFVTKQNIVFPVDNVHATEFMYNNNYKEFRVAKRMILGKKRNWQPENIYSRIGGNLG